MPQVLTINGFIINEEPSLYKEQKVCESCWHVASKIKLLEAIKKPIVRRGILRWEVDKKGKRRWILNNLIIKGKWQVHKSCAVRMGAGRSAH